MIYSAADIVIKEFNLTLEEEIEYWKKYLKKS